MRRPLLLMMCLIAFAANAARITEQQALEKARQFLQGKELKQVQKARGIQRVSPSPDLRSIYIYNVADNGGFVIVSGDDRTDAILGYSDRGSFDEESVPENFRAWLVQMESEIASLPEAATRAVDSAPTAAFRKVATHARIRPLIITTWNQGNYNNAINSDGVYNCHLPMIDGQYPCTGCVAVVGAQLMYYYRWPQAATQEVSGYASSLAATNNALPPIQFQWDKMKTSYYPGDPDAEAVSAVADLLLYSAYAANMEFGVDGSASSTYTLAQGLCSYFDYDPNSWREVQRSNYSVSQWDELIYNELANGRPVIYNGSYKGGHAFICDGYDGEGMYHFNWGWGGAYNGYFKLQATNPFGSNNIKNSGYIADNNCIIGLQPSSWPEITYQDAKDTWEVPETFGPVPTTLDVVITNSTVEWFSWNNYPSANTFRCGIGELNGDGTIELLSILRDYDSFDSGSGPVLSCDISMLGLSEGTHKLVPLCQLNGGAEWSLCKPSDLYFEVIVNGEDVSVTLHPIEKLTVNGFDLAKGGEPGNTQGIWLNVTNEGDHYEGYLYVFVGTADNIGNQAAGKTVKIAAGNTKDYHWSIGKLEEGTYTLRLATDWYGNNVVAEQEVTILQDLRATAFEVSGVKNVDRVVKVDVTVENHAGDYAVPLYLFAGTTEMKTLVYAAGSAIERGGSDIMSFYFMPDMVGVWNLWVATDQAGMNVIGQSTVEIVEPQEVTLTLLPQVLNAVDGVVKSDKFVVRVSVTNIGDNPYDDVIVADLYKLIPGTHSGSSAGSRQQALTLEPGASTSLDFAFDDLEDGSYFCWVNYYSKGEAKGRTGGYIYEFQYTPATFSLDMNGDGVVNIADVITAVNSGTARPEDILSIIQSILSETP